MSDDPYNWSDDPEAQEWIEDVLNDMAPKMASSKFVMSLVPDTEGDVKFWVELGASIMMGKPIIAVVAHDREIPPKLALVVDEVVRLPADGLNNQASVEMLHNAINIVAARLTQEEEES